MHDPDVILERIRARCRHDGYVNFPRGWSAIIADLDTRLATINPDYEVVQAKIKFGGLRYYITPYSPEAIALIQEAEEAAWRTCMICGDPAWGCWRTPGTMKGARCATHADTPIWEA